MRTKRGAAKPVNISIYRSSSHKVAPPLYNMTVQYFILGLVTTLVFVDIIIWTQTYRKRRIEEDEDEEEECSHTPETFTSWIWYGGTAIELFCDDCDEWITKPFEDLPVTLQMKARKARQEQYCSDGEVWKSGNNDILLKD